MPRNNIPLKVAIGYCAVAAVLALTLILVYGNRRSLQAVNTASREYVSQRAKADSAMALLLRQEQANLRDLSDAMRATPAQSSIDVKARRLDKGEDSVVVRPKAKQTTRQKSTTVEVVRTRKGFFRRVADLFRKERTDTVSVSVKADTAVTDTLAEPVNVAPSVATILKEVSREESAGDKERQQAVRREVDELARTSARLALSHAQQLRQAHLREQQTMRKSIGRAIAAQQQLVHRVMLLALVAVVAAAVLAWLVARDIRRERAHREQLERANEATRRVMRQRERLLLTITHDIKAPAASISGFADMMTDSVPKGRARDCLGHIRASASHLGRLVAELLDYHQLENGLMEARPERCVPRQLVAECAEAARLRAEKKGLRLSLSWTDDTATAAQHAPLGTPCSADAFRIRQILDNLIGNAVKYTDRGSVAITARLADADGASDTPMRLAVTIRDTGKGMTTQEKHDAMQPFARLANAQGEEGAGLGLAITSELVALLGGKMSVESIPGRGSAFTVTLPMGRAGEAEEPAPDPQAAPPAAPPLPPDAAILLLDDDPLQLKLLQEMLRRIGVAQERVVACGHVADALTAIHDRQPAVMLMDIEMPEMSGTEMARHIGHSAMRLVAMTAHDASILPQLREAGFDDCLFKPFTTAALARVLGMPSGHAAPAESPTKSAPAPSSRLSAMTAFADGDPEAEAEIIATVRHELAGYIAQLRHLVAAAASPSPTNSFPSPTSAAPVDAPSTQKAGEAADSKATPSTTPSSAKMPDSIVSSGEVSRKNQKVSQDNQPETGHHNVGEGHDYPKISQEEMAEGGHANTADAHETETEKQKELAEEAARLAHKLQPMAAMMQLQCLDMLTELSPERTKQLTTAQTLRRLRAIADELQSVLDEG